MKIVLGWLVGLVLVFMLFHVATHFDPVVSHPEDCQIEPMVTC